MIFGSPTVLTPGTTADGDDVNARSRDGLPVGISFSFNYRFMTDVDALTYLYIKYVKPLLLSCFLAAFLAGLHGVVGTTRQADTSAEALLLACEGN